MNSPRQKTRIEKQSESTWARFLRFHREMNRVLALVGAFAVFTLMLLISADVIGRSIFHKPVMGTYEIGQNLMVAIVFFGLGYTQMSGGNITVETLVRVLNPSVQFVLSFLTAVIGFIIFSLMAYSSCQLALVAWRHGRTMQGILGLPLYPAKFLVTLGSVILALHFLLDLIGNIEKCVSIMKRGGRSRG